MFIKNNDLLIIVFILIATCSCFSQGESGYKISDKSVDTLVDEGLSILGKNEFGVDYGHALRQLGFKPISYNTETNRFKIAVEKFQTALLNENKLTSYKPVLVRSFLAVAYCRLANAYEVSDIGNVDYDLDKRIAYGACFAEYERVIKGTATILTPRQTETYVAAIIKSGDLKLALHKINEIRIFNKAKSLSIKNLFFYEGDIYFKLGDKKKSGVAYDKWLRNKPDNIGVQDDIVVRLKDLNEETGFPTLKSLANLNN